MLTDAQVELLTEFSRAVFCGLLVGFIASSLAGIGIAVLRKKSHDIEALLRRCVVGICAGLVASVLVAVVFTVIDGTSVAPIGFKGVRESPDWLINTQVVLQLVCAVVVTVFVEVRAARPGANHWSRYLAWGLAGSLLGGMAGVGQGFEGYSCVQNNWGPIRYALCGAAIGAVLACLAAGVSRDAPDGARPC